MSSKIIKNLGETMKEKTRNTTDYKSFHYLENGEIDFSILHTDFTTSEIVSGIYDLCTKNVNHTYVPKLSVCNNTENFNSDISFYFEDKIDKIYNAFFDKVIKSKVNILGYNHKLGLLLYGKQGTGKTSMLKRYFNRVVEEEKGIVFNITSYKEFGVLWDFVKEVRKIQDNPIVIFLDEFEELVDAKEGYGEESLVKKMMDGFDSIDNCFFMMATNYIDKVPKTIKDRPSRVKYCIEVNGIEDEIKIGKFLKDSFDKVQMEVDFSADLPKLKGNTLDELKNYVLNVVMNIEIDSKQVNRLGYGK